MKAGKKKHTRKASRSACRADASAEPRPRPAAESFAKQMGKLTVSKEDMRIFTIEAMIDVMERALTTNPGESRACFDLEAEYELAWAPAVITRQGPRSDTAPKPWLVAGKAFEAIRSLASQSNLSELRNVTSSDDLPSRPLDEAIRRVREALRADIAA
jgi:hypothetical protein